MIAPAQKRRSLFDAMGKHQEHAARTFAQRQPSKPCLMAPGYMTLVVNIEHGVDPDGTQWRRVTFYDVRACCETVFRASYEFDASGRLIHSAMDTGEMFVG